MTSPTAISANSDSPEGCALHCGRCDACAFADAVRRELDASSSAIDDEAADRVAERALASLATTEGSARRTSRVRTSLLLIAAVIATGSAAAFTYARVRADRARETRAAVATHRIESRPAVIARTTHAAPIREPDEPAVPPQIEAPTTASVAARRIVRREPETAERLFEQANAARRSGAAGQARASELYLQLQRAYPSSDEARQALLSEARWLVDTGRDPRRALSLVDRFLQRTPSGSALEAALVTRAEAARAAGSASIERQSWEELLRRFPASLNAARARERSAALGADHNDPSTSRPR